MLNELMNSKNMRNFIDGCIFKCYGKYNIRIIMESEDFKQDCFLVLANKLKYFNEEKGTIKSFIYLIISSHAKTLIRNANRDKHKLNIVTYSINNCYKYNMKGDKELKFEDRVSDNTNIEKDYEDNELRDFLIERNKNNEKVVNIVRLLADGKNVTDIVNITKYTRCSIYKVLKELRKDCLLYLEGV